MSNIDAANLMINVTGTDNLDTWDNFETLDMWTEEIENSETDVYETEVGKFHKVKRILKPNSSSPGGWRIV